ncbi:MAG: TolC family protein [Pirellulaceae bacterium]|nr:TolC family protein [Pirellulaceae bacterium]
MGTRWIIVCAVAIVGAGCQSAPVAPSQFDGTPLTPTPQLAAAESSGVVQPAVFTTEPPVDSSAAEAVDSSPHDLSHFQQLALNAHPARNQLLAKIRALQGSWLQAGIAPNPTLSYMSENIGAVGTAGMQGAAIAQRVPTGGKRGWRQHVIEHQIIRIEQQLAELDERVKTDVRMAFIQALIARRRLELTEQFVDLGREATETSERLLEAGDIPRIGLLQTQVEFENARMLHRRAVNELLSARRRLAAVSAATESATEQLAGELGELPEPLDFEQQLQRLVAQSPEIAVAAAQVEQAQAALESAIAEITPDVQVQVAVQRDNAIRQDVAAVQIGVALPLWNKQQGLIRQRRAEIALAASNLERVEVDLRQRLVNAFEEYNDARVQTDDMAKEIIPKVERTMELVREGYAGGQLGYLDWTNAQRTYYQTKLSELEAIADVWESHVEIEGMLLQNSFNAPSQ